MKRTSARYPLARLLALRRREERDLEAELARRHRTLEREEQRLRSLEARRTRRPPSATTASQLQAEERSAGALRRRITEAREARGQASRAVESAERTLTAAARLREAVESDRAEWERQRRREEAAREQRDAEDALSANHGKRGSLR